jgi:hypothetical protein
MSSVRDKVHMEIKPLVTLFFINCFYYECLIKEFFFFFLFFGNFHFLQTLQTILNNYTTRKNTLANY